MACLAGGATFSLAPKSDLYLMKTRHYYMNLTNIQLGGNPEWTPVWETPDALHDAYFHIVDTVKERSLQGKAVISNSNGDCSSIQMVIPPGAQEEFPLT